MRSPAIPEAQWQLAQPTDTSTAEFIFTLMVPLVTRAETFLKLVALGGKWKLPTELVVVLATTLPAVSSSSTVTPSTPPVLQVLLLRAP